MRNKDSKNEYLIRFSLRQRLEHHLGAILFIALVVTGLAQRYHDAGWAQWIILALGGVDATRFVHRYAGLAFAVLALFHVAVASYGLLFRGWPASIVINRKDFEDVLTNLQYYIGRADRPARCDRFDYRQKFEYWGVILGSCLMIVTGFALWFPVTLFKLVPFLPGQLIPAAKAAHSNEAMLALVVIVIWHIYNSVFSPEVFPLDTAIFTGKISRERMLHEHPLEWERVNRIRLFNEQDSSPPVETAEEEITPAPEASGRSDAEENHPGGAAQRDRDSGRSGHRQQHQRAG